jgi:hypothetical protein
MRKLLARDIRTAVIAALTASIVMAAPAVGSAVVAMARNSDKVDGLHAVGSGASIRARRGKLVATSPKTGRLPNNIIATAPNATRLAGKSAGKFALKASLSSAGTINSATNPVAWSKLRGVPAGLMDGNDAIGPRAFARVDDAGHVDPSLSGNWDDEVVTHPAAETGVYCFELSFEPKHIQVTTDHRSTSVVDPGVQPYASFQPASINGNCDTVPGADAVVILRDGIGTRFNAAFFVSFM